MLEPSICPSFGRPTAWGLLALLPCDNPDKLHELCLASVQNWAGLRALQPFAWQAGHRIHRCCVLRWLASLLCYTLKERSPLFPVSAIQGAS